MPQMADISLASMAHCAKDCQGTPHPFPARIKTSEMDVLDKVSSKSLDLLCLPLCLNSFVLLQLNLNPLALESISTGYPPDGQLFIPLFEPLHQSVPVDGQFGWDLLACWLAHHVLLCMVVVVHSGQLCTVDNIESWLVCIAKWPMLVLVCSSSLIIASRVKTDVLFRVASY